MSHVSSPFVADWVMTRPASVCALSGPLCLGFDADLNVGHVNAKSADSFVAAIVTGKQRFSNSLVLHCAAAAITLVHVLLHSFAIPVSGVAVGLSEVPFVGGCRLRLGAVPSLGAGLCGGADQLSLI